MKSDRAYLAQILERVELAMEFAAGGRDEFRVDRKTQEAVIRELEVMGEASKRLSPRTKELAPKIPWKRMSGFRDLAIHQYERLDLDIVWALVASELPPIKAELIKLLKRLGRSDSDS